MLPKLVFDNAFLIGFSLRLDGRLAGRGGACLLPDLADGGGGIGNCLPNMFTKRFTSIIILLVKCGIESISRGKVSLIIIWQIGENIFQVKVYPNNSFE